jgi:hypothetical protein
MEKPIFGDFWIPPEQKKDQPYIPAIAPTPDRMPPPDFDPDKEKDHPDTGDNPEKDKEKKDRYDDPGEKTSDRGSVVIGGDEIDSREWKPFKSDTEL